jgi:hypothetical protein
MHFAKLEGNMLRFDHNKCTFVSIMPHCLIMTFTFLNCTSTCAAQGSYGEATGLLRYSDRTPGRFIPNALNLVKEPPEENWMLPEARGSERLYGTWLIGDQTKIKVVLDVMGEDNSMMRFATWRDSSIRQVTRLLAVWGRVNRRLGVRSLRLQTVPL